MSQDQRMKRTYRRPFKLFNKIQHYDWGTRNDDAFIPRFLGSPIVRDLPYAELWIGAHPSAPSDILVEARITPLNKAIADAPLEILGEDVARRFDNKLPFLLKVLSAATALSIQTHPNKEQARRLHATDPAHYPDDNHKPEIAIALESLTAIAGFRPAMEIVGTLREYPELSDLAGSDLMERVLATTREPDAVENLKLLYSTIMRRAAEKEKLLSVIVRIVGRLSRTGHMSKEQQHFVEQCELHGADVGLFSFLFFNIVHLKAGQAIFTEAGVPHAYMKGNIVECMANSDNVVRAGLTGKFKDVDALLDILTYRFAEYAIINREQKTDDVVYRTSAEEFEITGYRKEPGYEAVFESGGRPAVVLITEGSLIVQWEDNGGWRSESFAKGESFLIPAILSRWRMSGSEKVGFYVVAIPEHTARPVPQPL
jgi:mannose-6-phosphate isomerase